ncbi:MAG: DNA glycosylase [Nanoarchaeota archaeon]
MKSISVTDFNLTATLTSGQLFRYKQHEDGFIISHGDKIFFVSKRGNRLFYDGVKEKFLTYFFRLDEDHKAILLDINKDIFVNEAINNYRGLRLIRQDPWECLVGFVCSSAANIPKIRMNVNLLCKQFGKPISYMDNLYFSFPGPGELTDHEKIRLAKTGFRSRYLHAINNLVDASYLDTLQQMDYKQARATLMSLPGIGEKVADCILLFSLGCDKAFPVDTWVHKAMTQLYFPGKHVTPVSIQSFAQDYFGQCAGYAQQYLFHWMRNRKTNGI